MGIGNNLMVMALVSTTKNSLCLVEVLVFGGVGTGKSLVLALILATARWRVLQIDWWLVPAIAWWRQWYW